MKRNAGVGLDDVRDVYNGPEGALWELLMGEQIHIGGFASSCDLAEKADIRAGMEGIDLCCCNGAGMRVLCRCRGVARMTGVDATEHVIAQGRERCLAAGLDDRITFALVDAAATGLPAASADFVWGEDAWCYVVDKPALLAEAHRLVKPGGIIAFTDWVEGETEMSAEEAHRFLSFMKFPSLFTLQEYRDALTTAGCHVVLAEDTRRFAPYVQLYLQLLAEQYRYDVLNLVGFDEQMVGAIEAEFRWIHEVALQGKVAQGLVVARKES